MRFALGTWILCFTSPVLDSIIINLSFPCKQVPGFSHATGSDTCFLEKACDGLCRLLRFTGFWLKHHKGFNRACGPLSDTLQAGALLFPCYRKWPVPAFKSIWVVLWLLFFRCAPSTFPQMRGYLLGACFRESLVIRLHPYGHILLFMHHFNIMT